MLTKIGTGKSYIGSLIAKAIFLHSASRILVLSYTNHALVQFLEDLLDVGIRSSDIVRLGSQEKASDRTRDLGLYQQKPIKRNGRDFYALMNAKKQQIQSKGSELFNQFAKFEASSVTVRELMERSQFDLDRPEFCGAFDQPGDEDGMQRVGKKGKAVDEFYLFTRWCKKQNAGVFPDIAETFPAVWTMPAVQREEAISQWKSEILDERIAAFSDTGAAFNETVAELATISGENNREILRTKRIIGCTTTAAAKYVHDIQAAAPEIVLVEEAGEILESHVLTALGPETEQLILIGDHKQLRPKVHFDLSKAKGSGFDADVSLFERLVLKGYPHQTLSEQHRMRPEISKLVRSLTYSDLTDAAETLNRPDLRGFLGNLIFINHNYKEDSDSHNKMRDPRDMETGLSKRNKFEAKMTLGVVKYLAQQGYNSLDIVVLTPYVAQLRLLYDVLAKENDPVLNDLDSHDLVKAGLMPAGVAKSQKPRLKISSIGRLCLCLPDEAVHELLKLTLRLPDNYQGEQSDIVIISLTRSNDEGEIGFLSSPERLNVLLSRARNAMILIGNANTFQQSRKGKELWREFFHLLEDGRHFYEGFPIKCERHPEATAVIRHPDEFSKYCPDGGCDKPW